MFTKFMLMKKFNLPPEGILDHLEINYLKPEKAANNFIQEDIVMNMKQNDIFDEYRDNIKNTAILFASMFSNNGIEPPGFLADFAKGNISSGIDAVIDYYAEDKTMQPLSRLVIASEKLKSEFNRVAQKIEEPLSQQDWSAIKEILEDAKTDASDITQILEV